LVEKLCFQKYDQLTFFITTETDLSPKLSTQLSTMYKIPQLSPPPRREEPSGQHSETSPFRHYGLQGPPQRKLSSVRIAADPQSRPRPDPPTIASLRRKQSGISVLSFYTSASSEYRTTTDSTPAAWDDMEQASMTRISEGAWSDEHDTSQHNRNPRGFQNSNKVEPVQASSGARKDPATTPPPSLLPTRTDLPVTKLRAFWKRCLRYQTLKIMQILLAFYVGFLTYADIGPPGGLRDQETGFIVDQASEERTERGVILVNGVERAIVADTSFQVVCIGITRMSAFFMYPGTAIFVSLY
jgi:hypothetical protein